MPSFFKLVLQEALHFLLHHLNESNFQTCPQPFLHTRNRGVLSSFGLQHFSMVCPTVEGTFRPQRVNVINGSGVAEQSKLVRE
ncbi:hypothetical protein CEXT_574541 [Caerostris extrusa]|uniref:Secreted protein n=1 Tax=Caerostris extrusa TaxID=172846 RepID=A0AAV4UNP7_CAEEX|nr:hypothetical protein CEXT_574541 [Caerostris extrusa]